MGREQEKEKKNNNDDDNDTDNSHYNNTRSSKAIHRKGSWQRTKNSAPATMPRRNSVSTSAPQRVACVPFRVQFRPALDLLSALLSSSRRQPPNGPSGGQPWPVCPVPTPHPSPRATGGQQRFVRQLDPASSVVANTTKGLLALLEAAARTHGKAPAHNAKGKTCVDFHSPRPKRPLRRRPGGGMLLTSNPPPPTPPSPQPHPAFSPPT